MAIIATMTKHEDGSFTGVLTTLNVKANIRIAPTMPPLAELVEALEGLCTAILLAELEKLVG